MMELKGSQRKHLRGLAHNLNPAAFVGQKGLTDALMEEIDTALAASELIKIKFIDNKEKEVKTALVEEISKRVSCHVAGMIGHVAVLYRPHPNPDKRRINLP
ncbi:MAG: ribosome assembly RNA-binding protein YhbY [Desulfobacter sp.]|nr:MAG: ribosome assembly RNA-binding protein YhbY [Desulfobacter sp.]